MCPKSWKKKSQRGKSKNKTRQVSKPSRGSRRSSEGPAERPGKARPGDGQRGSVEAPEAVTGGGGAAWGAGGTLTGVRAHGMRGEGLLTMGADRSLGAC